MIPENDDIIQCAACFKTFNTTFSLEHHVCDAMTQIDSSHFEVIRAKAEQQPSF